MLKVGLIGIGFMGRGHLENYIKLESEGFPLKLVAICDIDPEKFENKFTPGNIKIGEKKFDFSKYRLYTSIDKMLENEKLDYVDIALPTYLHSQATVKALNAGINVLCEKPMALNLEQCQAMIDAAKKNNKKLMIGHCLRFWPAYEYAKELIDSKKYGDVIEAYFFRGGNTPKWSYQNWYLQKDKSGGVLLDQHIHDIDVVNWFFGLPHAVSTISTNILPTTGYDVVSTRYFFNDKKILTAEDDWLLNGEFPFEMRYRINFEKGNLIFEKGQLKVTPNEGKPFIPELSNENAYYKEIKYFANAVLNDLPIEVCPPSSSMETIKIALAEMESADNKGKTVNLI
ncbi:MAG: Gfo/Idh/MocA family oxidoreductase [Defluviitoga tunisiensis]|jgi:predicted dehydrogenase|uniref:Oxidoreductase family, NAD-binding Rossmann fold protein n=1 Tax=Defluviitoga tunisiensis TaxID=1006576 RepID=A0A0C7P1M6_DEFTU|nr:Gfo/Idh/MocA family oxidoreductase [Defluviitoga tunisiensis]MDD3600363.1 Gfo/Idh/MocA family oxidoreductase [Defluviitoga tunisiensis]CEP77884.1 Oxidoreductase family, NAD-binding Rossmann fold protein [Defluviitoga tunisiensis]HHV00992.1 Gfo/Idh/MocA family oxidoreductase [Defluviitoga tunisiensis]HOB54821.1 Gfo/Idh/MocA family oxidoreductase [Defluviitoga tunisiensis]HOK16275.1 Gfo/Idh/MocA family oxidoreductase [Defluviitoga tunisiensis]